jgi:hypothetical protein
MELHVIHESQHSYMFHQSKVGQDGMNHVRKFIAECVCAVPDVQRSVVLLSCAPKYCFRYTLLCVHTEAVRIACAVRL